MNINAFNWADYAILSIIGLSIFISLIRGFVRESLSLATWIIAFWIGFTFSPDLAPSLTNYISHENLRLVVAFVILFMTTLILGTLVSVLITQLVRKTGLSGTDRLLGVLFGAARGGLLVALLMLAASLFSASKESWWQKSIMIPKMAPMAAWLKDYLPENIKFALNNSDKEKSKWTASLLPDGVLKNSASEATENAEKKMNIKLEMPELAGLKSSNEKKVVQTNTQAATQSNTQANVQLHTQAKAQSPNEAEVNTQTQGNTRASTKVHVPFKLKDEG